MNPGDWEMPSMDHATLFAEPFNLDGEAIASDGAAVVAFPGRGKEFGVPTELTDQVRNQIKAYLAPAKSALVEPVDDIKSLGLSEQHTARLSTVDTLLVAIETNRIFFHAMDASSGELMAYGVVSRGAPQ